MSTTETKYFEKQGPGRPASKPDFTNQLKPVEDLGSYLKTYARENPESAAMWIFGLGFIVGWKMKPW